MVLFTLSSYQFLCQELNPVMKMLSLLLLLLLELLLQFFMLIIFNLVEGHPKVGFKE